MEAVMTETKNADILKADAEALVNTVNCVGVMGRGIALQFRKAYPENFKAYKRLCDQRQLRPGKVFIHNQSALLNPRYIINFPTKDHWKGNSRIEFIQQGLLDLVAQVAQLKIRSIAIPPLGCGLGGLQWTQVKPLIQQAFSKLPEVQVLLFEPQDQGRDVNATSAKEPEMTQGRAALLGLMQRYLDGLMDPAISLLQIHKLAYFLQAAGEPLRLKYAKAAYGPYAENLRHVLHHIEGHYLRGYQDGGDAPSKELEILPGAIEKASAFLEESQETRQRFDRVAQLIDGYESSFGLELLSTVHWVKTQENAQTAADTIALVHSWNRQKVKFSPEQIAIAIDTLEAQAWLPRVDKEQDASITAR